MKFKANTRRKAIEYEKGLVRYWKEQKTFEKSVEQRPADNAFVFYDGPPFLTGTPHHGHLLVSAVKDAVARYQTMQGKRVERRWGWDCHGLPAEVFVEKQLGIANKKEIGTKISIQDYVQACRAAMVKTGTEWEDTIERLGRWVEFQGAYKTMDKEFMESVWWAFKKLYDEGKVYEGEKILVYCTKDATPISKSEVAMENSYQKDTDPSVYVYFQIDDTDEAMLAWTTTPWTLPANVAVAVHPDIQYSLVEHDGRKFYVATAALERVMVDDKKQKLAYTVVKNIQGSELVGRRYRPLFENRGPQAHYILAADFVTADDGTGLVHEAPAYGEEDYELCKKNNIPIVSIVDENGNYTEGEWLGRNIWDVNKEIAKTLVADGRALKVEYILHDYPHCHRCGTKLMYRAHPSWFMDIQLQKAEMLQANEQTRWKPDGLRTGRFQNIIQGAPDWNLSRDRYWATPIPVWRGQRPDGTEVLKVVGSYDEFEELTGKRFDDYHLPSVMDVTFECDGVEMRHIGKVLDCWFESGSMPFAQFHYPFENKAKFEASFPADFIIEAIDQTRGWFYSLTAVNVALFGQSPFMNLICTGFMNAADGKKMSKKLKNYTDPMELMDAYSVDAFRFMLLSSPLLNGEDFALKDKDVQDIQRKLAMIWNMYDFFTLYASVDGWEWQGSLSDPMSTLTNPLDRWIVSRLHQLEATVAEYMDDYDFQKALEGVLPFLDDASNWYVRRSRRRFWRESTVASSEAEKSEDTDKGQAYQTLHYVLVKLSMALAPFTPFLAEELYQQLTGGESVHLADWSHTGSVDETVLADMKLTRTIIEQGLAVRMQKNEHETQVKVRQPLASLSYTSQVQLQPYYQSVIADEVNVKEVLWQSATELATNVDKNITPELKREGMAREVIRAVQNARKQAGLQVDDRIVLCLSTADQELQAAIQEHEAVIMAETLTQERATSCEQGNNTEVAVDGAVLSVALRRV